MALMELGMDLHGTVDNRLIITKHVALVPYGNSKVPESVAQVDDLLNTGTGSHKLRTIGSSFHCGLLLGVPVKGGLVEQVEDPCDRSPSDDIMHEVGINIMCQSHKLPKWLWSICRFDLLKLPIHTLGPIILKVGNV